MPDLQRQSENPGLAKFAKAGHQQEINLDVRRFDDPVRLVEGRAANICPVPLPSQKPWRPDSGSAELLRQSSSQMLACGRLKVGQIYIRSRALGIITKKVNQTKKGKFFRSRLSSNSDKTMPTTLTKNRTAALAGLNSPWSKASRNGLRKR